MSKMLRKYETLCCYFCDTGTEREIPDIKLPKIREKLFPTEKSETQIGENFSPRNAQNRQSETLNSRENFVPHTPRNVHLWFQSMVQKRRMLKLSNIELQRVGSVVRAR